MFAEGTAAHFAYQIGIIQGRLSLCDDWAKLNGGFEIIARPHRDKMEGQIESLQKKIEKLRTARRA